MGLSSFIRPLKPKKFHSCIIQALPYILFTLRPPRHKKKTCYCAGTCSALNAVAQASDTATAAAGAAAAAVAGGECATSNFVAATASATAAAAAYVSLERHLLMLALI